jgi:hypothetical protein
VRGTSRGGAFSKFFTLNINDIAQNGLYRISYWIYMYCRLNCQAGVGYINLVIQNEDQITLIDRTNTYDQSEYKSPRWVQMTAIFGNPKKNIKVWL